MGQASRISFTYLDLIEPTIQFVPVMAMNGQPQTAPPVFSEDASRPCPIPGYRGKRCIIDLRIARELAKIQARLATQGYSLRIYDAYRPQKAVNYLTEWTRKPDLPEVKALHYPRVEKARFHELSYLSRTSSHTLGTAVDLTLGYLDGNAPRGEMADRPEGFLGLWDFQSLDMGNVGYLAFDERSGHAWDQLSGEQRRNRNLLRESMLAAGFEPLRTEFWHYYFDRNRNREHFFDFDVRDDYPVRDDLTILFNEE